MKLSCEQSAVPKRGLGWRCESIYCWHMDGLDATVGVSSPRERCSYITVFLGMFCRAQDVLREAGVPSDPQIKVCIVLTYLPLQLCRAHVSKNGFPVSN